MLLSRSFRDWVGLKGRLSLVWWRKRLSKEMEEELQAEAVAGVKALRWEGALNITVPTIESGDDLVGLPVDACYMGEQMGLGCIHCMYSFSIAAITVYHELSGSKQYKFIIISSVG